MKSYKVIVVIIICLIIIAATFYFFWPVYQEKFKEKEVPRENVNIQIATPSPEPPATRPELIKYIEENINDFYTNQPQEIEKWKVTRFGFESNKDENVYVEFDDGHGLLKILLWCKEFGGKFECKKINTFEPDNFEWKIDQGKDPFIDKAIYYYEKDGDEWKKIGTSEDLRFFPISYDALLEIQKTVDQDYLNWRKSALSVLRQDMPREFNFDINRDQFKPIARDEKEGKITFQITFQNADTWDVILSQPIKKGEGGVWVIERMTKYKR